MVERVMGAEASCCAARPKKKGEQDGGSNKLSLKVVVVGDGAVGKTCLLVVFRDDKFPEEWVLRTTSRMQQVTYAVWTTQ